MSDFIYVAVLVGFFALCALYVQLCDRLIGPVDPGLVDTGTGTGNENGNGVTE